MKCFQLRLKPDIDLPVFSRLDWDIIDVSFRDVLEQGIHPWSGDNQHHDLPKAFSNRLNQDSQKPAGLESHHLMPDLEVGHAAQYYRSTCFEQLLAKTREDVLFCDPLLDFPTLAEVARKKLRDGWRSGMALQLAERLHPSFQELRRFLKSKDRTVKLKGQFDLENYDWARILSLDDFDSFERLLIEEAIHPLNFRDGAFLDSVTDPHGRLRLAGTIDAVTLTQLAIVGNHVPLLWQAKRHGNHWRFRPNVGASQFARVSAREFAARWLRDGGKLCFTARTQDLIDMVESGEAKASFPGLRYTMNSVPEKIAGTVNKDRVPLYVPGSIPTQRNSAEELKVILREHGVATTGVKKVLVEKIAKLAEGEYRTHEGQLDRYFSENRFVRVSCEVAWGERFPVLTDDSLKGLLIRLYALRHLRGNAVVDPSHENDSCPVKDLAHALITERVSLRCGFVRVE